MANGEYGFIKSLEPSIGIGTIQPDIRRGGDVHFSTGVVQGGMDGFADLKEGDRVGFRRYPETVNGLEYAEMVYRT